MALYRYVKAPPVRRRVHKKPMWLSFVFMGLGGAILIWVLWPIVSFSLVGDQLFAKTITPMNEASDMAKTTSLSTVAYAAGTDGFNSGTDISVNANTWYPMVPQQHVNTEVNTYTLSIPKLRINNALVTIGGDNLDESLVHYGGTGVPGQYGTAVVFGHSNLPQFYQPTDYKTIFSLLPTLKIGDPIIVTYDGVTYKYVVYDMVVVDPTDLSTLEQQFDDSYLTLVTCVPPGTLWKRLDVKAKLSTI